MSDLQTQIEELWAGSADLSVDDAGANAAIHLSLIHISEPTRPY